MGSSKVNLVIIGHKDHGKSTLIGRLLYDSKAIPEQKLKEVEAELKKAGGGGFRFAFLLDTLEEERRGGLTIDIMQTPFKSGKRLYTIIDCPGHREFAKKMLTGASQADAAVLVVSAKEGVEDQTRQHAFLVKTLGIQQLVVAVNKMDLVDYAEVSFADVCEKLRPILNSLGYEDTPIVPLSALNGENVFAKSERMPWYGGPSLVEALDESLSPAAPPVSKSLRACVQDVYEMGGKRVVVCKVLTGTLRAGEKVCFDPSGKTGRVKELESFGGEVEAAGPGDSVGVVFDPQMEAARGEVVSHPSDRANVPGSFLAEMVLFSNAEVKAGDALRIRCGTAERSCKVLEIVEKVDPVNLTVAEMRPGKLGSGEIGKLVLAPLEPLCVEEYSKFPELGRFVVENAKGAAAAGIVLKTFAGGADRLGI
ncbi:MAG: GTP-binding protein [Candidatus Brockarchaeota archaeon]|nr:GTP-binding protein [Candidatus Brockarchaeota archaeon]